MGSFPHPELEEQRALRKRLHQFQTRLHLLKSITTQINSGLSANQIIQRTMQEAHKSFPGLRVSFSTIGAPHLLSVVHSIAPPSMPNLLGAEQPLMNCEAMMQALEAGQAIVAADVSRDLRLQPLADLLAANGTRALIVVPIRQPENQMAILAFTSGEIRAWDEYEIVTLCDMAEYLSVALREAHAEHERLKIEQRLRDSQKMEITGRLVGGIAHDFNNLLTGMMIYCGLLETALGKGHHLQRHVCEIQSAGQRGAQLVGQLLASTSQQVLEPKVILINDVLMESHDLLRCLIREDIEVEMQCAQDLKYVRVDPAQLQQVILNLAINAQDAMPAGGHLWIKTRNCGVDDVLARVLPGIAVGDYVSLSVADNGEGMDKQTQSRIFEPFFTTKERGKGAGLGLATVHGIVDQHGGYISVQSELGKGSTFEIFLPGIQAGSRVEPEEEIPRPLGLPSLRLRGESLLLVEDDEMVRRSLVESLRLSGYQVLEAAGGDQALQIASQYPGPIPLMITDLIMPGMGGGELAQKLSLERPETEVLYISGYTDDPRTRSLMGEGVEFLGKPFSSWALIEKIQTILSAVRGAVAVPVPAPALVRFS